MVPTKALLIGVAVFILGCVLLSIDARVLSTLRGAYLPPPSSQQTNTHTHTDTHTHTQYAIDFSDSYRSKTVCLDSPFRRTSVNYREGEYEVDAEMMFEAIHKWQTAGIEGSLFENCDDVKYLVSIMPGMGLMASLSMGPFQGFLSAINSNRIFVVMNNTPDLPGRVELPQLSSAWFMSDGGTVEEVRTFCQ